MKIDQLPIEMLTKIFGYLSRYDEVVLVNKLFYSVIHKINDPYICLRLDERLFKQNWMPSIENSTRQISKLDIYFPYLDEAACRAMISIITKFGAFIKRLRITGTRVTLPEFLEILSLIPNVEHLVLERLHLRDKTKLKRRRKLSNNDLNLHKLKKFQFTGENIVEKDNVLPVFDRLPVGVLTELELTCFQMDDLVILTKRQSNITKLKLTEFCCQPVHIFDNLRLESLLISPHSYGDITTLLSNQTQLKTLSIPHREANEDFLNLIASQMTELETLSISTVPSPSCIANIGKLKSLKEFSVRLDGVTATNRVESLAEYPNVGITSLSLDISCLNVNIVPALAKSLTKLTILKIYGFEDCAAVINAFLTNFNFVEILHIRGEIDGYNQLNDGDCFNPKLSELIAPLPKNVSRMYLTKLIADYPNLKKFQIDWNLITSAQFRQILNGFTKLETLTFIGSAEELTVDDLNYLKEHKNNLKFVSLGGMRVRFTDKIKRHLSNVFGVIICNDYTTRIMAVDRHTMNRERLSKEK